MTASAVKVDIWNRALARIGHTKFIQNETDKTIEARTCGQLHDDLIGEVLEQIRWKFAKKQVPISKIDTQVEAYDYDVDLSHTDFEIPFSYLDNSQVSVDVEGSVLESGTDYSITDATAAAFARVVLIVPLAVGQTITITVSTERVPWEHVYALPNDCVTPITLLDEGESYDQMQVEDRPAFDVMSNDAGTGRILCTDLDIDTDFEVLEYIASVSYVPAMSRQFVDALVWRLAADLALALPKDTRKSDWCFDKFRASISLAEKAMRDLGDLGIPPDSPSIEARK